MPLSRKIVFQTANQLLWVWPPLWVCLGSPSFCSIQTETPVLPRQCPHLSHKMTEEGASDFRLQAPGCNPLLITFSVCMCVWEESGSVEE